MCIDTRDSSDNDKIVKSLVGAKEEHNLSREDVIITDSQKILEYFLNVCIYRGNLVRTRVFSIFPK